MGPQNWAAASPWILRAANSIHGDKTSAKHLAEVTILTHALGQSQMVQEEGNASIQFAKLTEK